MAPMRDTARRPETAPRRRGAVALFVVALLAFALALGLTSHHDDAGAPASVDSSIIAPALVDTAVVDTAGPTSPEGDTLLACSFLVLCCVALLLILIRARRAVVEQRVVAPPGLAAPMPLVERLVPSLSLHSLSISRT